MSIGTPVGIGAGGQFASATTYVLTTTADSPAGNAIVIGGLNAGAAYSGIVDSAGNTYTIADTKQDGSGVGNTVAYCLNALHLPNGGTITATFSGSLFWQGMTAFTVSGIATSSAADVVYDTTQGATASLSAGPTSATAQANELVVCCFVVYDGAHSTQSFTAGAGYTALPGALASNGSASVEAWLEYQIVSATGTQTATGTLGAAPTTSSGIIVTFEAAASADPYPLGYPQPSSTVWRL